MSNGETVFGSNVRIENNGSIKLNSKKDIVYVDPIDTYNVTSNTITKIIYVNGYYIFCDSRGYIAYTNDISKSSSWNKYIVGNDNSWYSMTYANGYYILCGTTRHIAYTNDITKSSSWITYEITYLDTKNTYLNNISYVNGYYIAVGDTGFFGYTNDITNSSSWTAYLLPGSYKIRKLIFVNGYYIICGHKVYSGNGYFAGFIAYTNDITNSSSWKKYAIGNHPMSLIYGNGYYIICDFYSKSGDSGCIAYTNDITNSSSWKEYSVGNNINWYSLIYENENYILCGSKGNIASTKNITDPDSWYIRTIGTKVWYSIAFINDNIVLGCENGDITYGNIKEEISQPTISSASNGNLYISNTPMIEMLANMQTKYTQLSIIAPSRKNAGVRIMIGTANESFRSADFGFVDSDTDPYTVTKVDNADADLRVYKNRVQVIGNLNVSGKVNQNSSQTITHLTTLTGTTYNTNPYESLSNCELEELNRQRAEQDLEPVTNIIHNYANIEIGVWCESDGQISDVYKNNIGPKDCICSIRKTESLNENVLGIVVQNDPLMFASHGDCLVKCADKSTVKLGDILIPTSNGLSKVASNDEITYCIQHAIPLAKVISLNIPSDEYKNTVAVFLK